MRVGLDIGYSSVKLVYGEGQDPEMTRLPVGASPESKCGLAIDGSVAVGGGHRVRINGEPWVAGIDPARLTDFVSTMDESYPTTDEYRALFYAALSETNAPVIDMLVTGLPVSHFQDPPVKNGLLKLMKGRHYVRDDFVVEVKNVMVIPQPAGAFGAFQFDAAHSRDRTRHQIDASSSVLVVDPGHYSLDWVIYQGGFKLESSGSTSTAGEVVVRRASELLTSRYGVRVRPAKLQDAVLSGAKPLQIGGQTIEFWPALKEVAGDIVKSNLKALRGSVRSVSDARGVDHVLIAGGGADLFEEALVAAFPESGVQKMGDSVMANARGFFAFASKAKLG